MSRAFRSMLYLGILTMTASLACASIAQAGFIQTEDDGSTLYVQNGKLRGETSEEGDMWSVIDMTKGTIMMVNPEEKTYYEGTIDEYCAGMRTMMDAMSQFMGGMMPKPEQRKIKVEIAKVGPCDKIAGYDTTRYKVLTDGVLREEIWLANDKTLMKELGNPQSMAKFSQCMAMETEFEASAEYLELMKTGWSLKTVAYIGSEAETDSEVLSIEKADIPDSKFAAPKDYSKTPMTEMFSAVSQ